ncbi:MAG: FG-GAP repeat protein, partial [Nitrososphaera sp.]
QRWNQDSTGVIDSSEPGDVFGTRLYTGDFNNDDKEDLAVGVPGEDISTDVTQNVGAVNLLYGSTSGLRSSASGSTPDDQLWHQNISSVKDTAENGDQFGLALPLSPERFI